MKAKFFSAAVIIVTSMHGIPAYAANVLSVEDLEAMGDFAEVICPTVPMKSTDKKVSLSANIEAKLPKLILSLGNLVGDLEWQKRETEGVIQEELHEVIINSNDCRRDVLNFLRNLFGKKRNDSSEFMPIFSPCKIQLISSCKEKNVSCTPPGRSDSLRYGYTSEFVHGCSGGSGDTTFPGNIGRIDAVSIDGKISITFEYTGNPDDEFGNVEVCLCPAP